MYRLHTQLKTTLGAVLVLLLLSGCTGLDLSGNLAGLGGSEDQSKDETVYQVLGETVEVDAANPAVLPNDEDTYFAEDVTLYTESIPSIIELSEESILSDATTPEGEPPAAYGPLAGRFWNDVPDLTSDESGGIFRGRWMANDGRPLGVLRGEYHPHRANEMPDGLAGGGVFHGKYIDNAGHFRGVLRGRYGHGPDGRGLFFGRWFDRHERLVGILKGHWRDEPDTQGGSFAGHWVAFNLCDEVATLPELEFEDNDFGGYDTSDVALAGIAYDLIDETSLTSEPDVLNTDGPPCIDPNLPFGWLRGRYRPGPPEGEDPNLPPPLEAKDPNLPGGVFHGHWHGMNYAVTGKLFGHYEPRPPDPNEVVFIPGEEPPPEGWIHGVFYGKYVGQDGTFRGFLRGVYGRSVHGLGVFHGHYFDGSGMEKGVLLGRWAHTPHRPGGPFFGVWFGEDLDEEP